MQPKPRILLIEDEAPIAEFVATILRSENFEVLVESDGMRGMVAAYREEPDLVILDRMIPGLDGLELCRRLRRTSDVPILMLSAMGKPAERVEGLNTGASDYLAKPFDLEELVARVHAQLRMRRPRPKTCFVHGELSLDVSTREVRCGDRLIALTPKEFDLLALFMQHPRQVLTRAQILKAIWGYDYDGHDNVIEVYVRYVRNKLKAERLGRLIHTVRGVGYVLKEETP
ncbi:MAG TPA: response regulator transcription factor [Stenomitos sp.]